MMKTSTLSNIIVSSYQKTDGFITINEKPVDDISLEFFYKPHSITLLAISIAVVIYTAFVRDTENVENNIWAGILCCVFFFMIISVLAFPNGPFIRPHPAIWRMVFGLSVLYLLLMLFVLFQKYETHFTQFPRNSLMSTVRPYLVALLVAIFSFLLKMVSYEYLLLTPVALVGLAVLRIADMMSLEPQWQPYELRYLLYFLSVRNILLWLNPSLKNFRIDMEREYAVNCSDISLERIWSHMDVFAVGHFLGWMFKAILIRHMGILWSISFMWEITEIAFAHLLPNFKECWWDALILDVIVCNGAGIWCGLKICEILEMREYKWVGIRDIHSTTGKIKRAMLQFTPESFTSVRWLDPKCSYMRIVALLQLVIFWQTSELNTFFLKHIFEMPPSHPFVSGRLIFIGVVVAPSVRQYYSYITDTTCKRVGTQCWVYGCIMVAEALVCIKHGRELFERTQATNIVIWLLIQLLLTVLFIGGCVFYNKFIHSEYDQASGDGYLSRDNSPNKNTRTKLLNYGNVFEKLD